MKGIYFISYDKNKYKIGCSKHIFKRFGEIKVSSPNCFLYMIIPVDNIFKVEKYYHTIFQQYRISNEIFSLPIDFEKNIIQPKYKDRLTFHYKNGTISLTFKDMTWQYSHPFIDLLDEVNENQFKLSDETIDNPYTTKLSSIQNIQIKNIQLYIRYTFGVYNVSAT